MSNAAALGALRALQKKVAELRPGARFRRQASQALAGVALRQVEIGFEQSRDPYGRPWAPRKRPKAWAIKAFGLMQDRHPLLIYSGRLMRSFTAASTALGFRLRTNRSYAGFHQYGTRKMARRQLVPEGAMGIIWGVAVNREADTLMHALMGA